jgi:hypothetical protein
MEYEEDESLDDENGVTTQSLIVGGSSGGYRRGGGEYEAVHNRTFNGDRHKNAKLKFDLDRGSEKTRITKERHLGPGDDASSIYHRHRMDDEVHSSA